MFADAALEAKPAEWKMAFRAGKPAADAARAFAQKWLADLQSSGREVGPQKAQNNHPGPQKARKDPR